MTVWVVVFSNYEPPEVNSLWTTEERAKEWADSLEEHDWRVVAWEVRE